MLEARRKPQEQIENEDVREEDEVSETETEAGSDMEEIMTSES